MAVALALAAALCFALGSVLQRRVAGAGLLRLARQPAWLAGLAADAAGFAAQAAALGAGRLAVVQPLLASSLVFALLLGAAGERRRLALGELRAAAAVVGGLALFLTLAQPAGGREDAAPVAWLVTFAACGAVCAVCRRGPVRLGVATGVLFGLSAALTKATVERLDGGLLHALVDWHVVALVVVGYASMALSQASLRAGTLGTAVAAQMAFDAITSLLIGLLAFGERIHAGAAGGAFALAGVTLVVAGIAALAATPSRRATAGSPRPARRARRPSARPRDPRR
jgi:drug/metabolite transporter (DMT)-like permease